MPQTGVGSGRFLEEVTSKPKPEQYISIGQIGSLCIVGGGGVAECEIMQEETNANAQR